MLHYKTGNIFTSSMACVVNTVNCSGVMGAGIALECKLRYPDMFAKYQHFCQQGQLQVGKLWLYEVPNQQFKFKQVLNFPTKNDWKLPSKLSYIEQGLEKFVSSYPEKGITSVAFPVLGGGRGGLDESLVLQCMHDHLTPCNIDIEIWQFDSSAQDDVWPAIAAYLQQTPLAQASKQLAIRPNTLQRVISALEQGNISSICRLSAEPGIGEQTLSKLLHAQLVPSSAAAVEQGSLF